MAPLRPLFKASRLALLLMFFTTRFLCSCTKPADEPKLNVRILWSKTFGGTSTEFANDLVCDQAGNYLLSAMAFSQDGDLSGYPYSKGWLVKFSNAGDKLWQNPLVSSNARIAYCSDGSIITAGSSDAGVTAAKYDGLGNLQWQNTIDSGMSSVTGLLETSTGYIESNNTAGLFVNYSHVRALSKTGQVMARGNQSGENECLAAMPNNQYLVAGQSSSESNGAKPYAFYSTFDANANRTSFNQLGGLGDRLTAVLVHSDGGVLIGGQTTSNGQDVPSSRGGGDVWLMSMNAGGYVLWSKSFGGSGTEIAKSIVETDDGNYLIAATSNSKDGDVKSNFGGNDIWLLKVDRNGKLLAQQNMGGTGDDSVTRLIRDNTGAYVLVGQTSSNDGQVTGNHGDADVWIIKFTLE